MALHINIEDLLSARTVESDRIEYKEGWNPDAIYRSICAFANDFNNTGGGYILIGVEEENGMAKRPVKGLSVEELDGIQRKMIGFNNQIEPPYHTRLFIEEVDGKQILVLWISGGSNRPYKVAENVTANQKRYFYYIRQYSNSVKANTEQQQELIALANQIPFDDRANTQASVNDISIVLVQDHLRKIGSKLADDIGKRPNSDVLQQMELLSGPVEHIFPRNVALMVFSEYPEKYFPYTQVEIIYFPKGAAGKEFTEKIIRGPVPSQISQTLDYLKTSFLVEKVTKIAGKAEAVRVWNYPFAALEEAVANCLFHRNYQEREPVKIKIVPEAIILYNSGGPDRSIRKEDFASGNVLPKRYRNRRLGDFLKELHLTEGHATGLPAICSVMKSNGSPDPVFDFDEDRTWFQVTLPLHPAFVEIATTNKYEDSILFELDEELATFIANAPDKIGAKVRDVAGDIAGDAAKKEFKARLRRNDESIARDIVGAIDRDAVVHAAIDAQEFINSKMEKILLFCQKPKQRKDILQEIGLVNNVKNYDTYVAPLVQLGWVAMTVPDKPTSPNQQYRTTLKGKIITELMNYIEDGKG